MLDRALKGSPRYWIWIVFLLLVIGTGLEIFLYQLRVGPVITGLGRDVSWGLDISQYAYFVGIAAGGVMIAMPLYLHDYKAFARIAVFGEFLAVAALVMVGLFVFADLGRVDRLNNIFLHGQPRSILFWNTIILNGYLLLNLVIGWNVLSAERKGVHHPKWITPLIYISIPWAFSIHTSTAFVFAGLPSRHFWLSAIMAPRFLSSAFCAGPALLLLLCLLIKRIASFDPGDKAIEMLRGIITYAFIINTFFFVVELFTAFYSQIPAGMEPIIYLFTGLQGHGRFAPLMWVFALLTVFGLVILIVPATRRKEGTLAVGCLAVLLSTGIDKGLSFVPGGLIINPFGKVTEYWPTTPEVALVFAIYAVGALIITILYKMAISVKKEIE